MEVKRVERLNVPEAMKQAVRDAERFHDGAPVVFRTVFKATPSIGRTQDTVNLRTEANDTVEVTGRHDPCIVPRAVAVVEAMAALTIADQIARGYR